MSKSNTKRLTIKQFAEAYKIMKARGWSMIAARYCNKTDKQVCPVAALVLSARKTLPRDPEDIDFQRRAVRRFGVSADYVAGIVMGVDDTEGTVFIDKQYINKVAGYKLGLKLYAKFIKPLVS